MGVGIENREGGSLTDKYKEASYLGPSTSVEISTLLKALKPHVDVVHLGDSDHKSRELTNFVLDAGKLQAGGVTHLHTETGQIHQKHADDLVSGKIDTTGFVLRMIDDGFINGTRPGIKGDQEYLRDLANTIVQAREVGVDVRFSDPLADKGLVLRYAFERNFYELGNVENEFFTPDAMKRLGVDALREAFSADSDAVLYDIIYDPSQQDMVKEKIKGLLVDQHVDWISDQLLFGNKSEEAHLFLADLFEISEEAAQKLWFEAQNDVEQGKELLERLKTATEDITPETFDVINRRWTNVRIGDKELAENVAADSKDGEFHVIFYGDAHGSKPEDLNEHLSDLGLSSLKISVFENKQVYLDTVSYYAQENAEIDTGVGLDKPELVYFTDTGTVHTTPDTPDNIKQELASIAEQTPQILPEKAPQEAPILTKP